MTIYGQERLAGPAVALWRRRGPDTLVRILPYRAQPEAGAPIGRCTTLRFALGLRPGAMVTLAEAEHESDLAGGAEIFTLSPLPEPEEFSLTGYAPAPPPPPPPPAPAEGEGEAEAAEPTRSAERAPPPVPPAPHPLYLPGRGAPLWRVEAPQSRLVWLASVPGGTVFRYEPRLLAPLR